MRSSAKTGNFFFRGSPEHFLHKNAIWDRTPPYLHINCSLHMCRRVQESQIFKQNSIISIRSKVMAFLVISLSLWSPCCPCGPHVIPIIPIIPMSPLCHPHCPHIVPIAPRRSPCGPHGCGLRGLCGLHPTLSHGPCRPHISPKSSACHPHIISIIPTLSPYPPEGPHVVLMAVVSVVSTPCCPCRPRRPNVISIIPIVPTSSPHHLEGPHIISNPPDTHCTHPSPPGGWGTPNQ